MRSCGGGNGNGDAFEKTGEEKSELGVGFTPSDFFFFLEYLFHKHVITLNTTHST